MNRSSLTRNRAWRLAVSVLLLSATPGLLFGAGEMRRSFEYDLLFPQSRGGAIPSATVVGMEVAPAMEAPIDPSAYRVVPGDILQLEVGGESDRAWRLTIDAEGKLVLPGTITIDAVGSRLLDLVVTARATLAEQFPDQPIELHLLQPGSFRVPVTGLIENPSLQIFRSFDRVAHAIHVAGGPRPGASLRHILLRNETEQTEQEIDLVRFAILGELDQNPYLTPGCSIHLPAAEAFVEISGAVHGLVGQRGGSIPNVGSRIPETPRLSLEWKEGDTIGLILTRAGGPSEEASGELILTRGEERISLMIEEASDRPAQAGDRIEVSLQDRYVYVVGAVRYPGPYAHLPSRTAADYVRIAGGPTEIGRGGGWRVRTPDGRETDDVGKETTIPPGTTITVPERWTYRVSTLLGPISGITALVISLVALRN